MIRSLYHRILRLAATPAAPWWLCVIAFTEASVFPIPPDALLIPMVLARPSRGWWLALICTLFSVMGAVLGYAIGAVFFDRIAHPVLRAYGYLPAFAAFQKMYAVYGVRIILLKGLTPIPFKIVAIASGAAHFNPMLFLAACLVTRGARFFLITGILLTCGDRARLFLEKHLTWIALATLAAILAGFALLRVL